MAKSSKVTMSLTMRSSDIVPTGLERSVSMTVTATDDTSEFGKMVTTTSNQRIDKNTIADRAYVYVKNISSTSTVVVYLGLDLNSNSANAYTAGIHNGPRFAELAVGEFALIPFKDLDGTSPTDSGIHVKSSDAGEIEYLIFELD